MVKYNTLWSPFFNNKEKRKALLDIKCGIERETQRIDQNGQIALTDHPKIFGDKIENSQITVDFAENQLEFVTKVHTKTDSLLDELDRIHNLANEGIGSELMWPLSMPPRLPDEKMIRIAQFDQSETGNEKEIYRRGLALRYGKPIQMISGIHYNFSLGTSLTKILSGNLSEGLSGQNAINALYMRLARNFMKHRWLLIYLFGASPIADSSYDEVLKKELSKIGANMEQFNEEKSMFHDYATSLRVSRFGYSTEITEQFPISYHDLSSYVKGMEQLLTTKHDRYVKLGTHINDHQVQLNTNVIQNESEFYAPIRLKRMGLNHETQTEALKRAGIQYVEVRLLDINPFEKLGINKQQLDFMHLFMLYCLLEDDQPLSNQALQLAKINHHLVAILGRLSRLKLYDSHGKRILLQNLANQIFNKLADLARLIDNDRHGYYCQVVMNEKAKLYDQSLLYSELSIKEMNARHESFLDFGLRYAHEYKYDDLCSKEA
ncbi:glutamate--cysteine ligase [Amphibacillus sediminis]|uniref:glutamate--cysteine ligase n=1 Tax=Amphibacillus sediminis TaxID=360185 RepID=UPI00082BA381|nr:glutamate--cysteine ligase [Amphibacillus sediminis]